MDRPVTDTPHRIIRPEGLVEPRGFAHALVAAEGRTVFLGGQTGHRQDGSLVGDDLVAQFDQACANVVTALEAAGARPEQLVQLLIFATDMTEYRSRLKELGEAYRRHFGKHYPAMALLGTTELFDAEAKVELIGTAVVPE
ncbi:MAG TPA: RidA family protein [Actinomycetota bacterium]|nr:RidA family protein [Actinomycetota bacterium]